MSGYAAAWCPSRCAWMVFSDLGTIVATDVSEDLMKALCNRLNRARRDRLARLQPRPQTCPEAVCGEGGNALLAPPHPGAPWRRNAASTAVR